MIVYKELRNLKNILKTEQFDGKETVNIENLVAQIDFILLQEDTDVNKDFTNGEIVTLNGGLEYYFIGKHPMYPRYSCCMRVNSSDVKNIEVFDTSLLRKKI